MKMFLIGYVITVKLEYLSLIVFLTTIREKLAKILEFALKISFSKIF